MCITLNYFDIFLIFVSVVIGCVSVADFTSLLSVPVGITCSAVGLKIWALAARIKIHKLIIKKKREKHDKILFFAKVKFNQIEVLISKALIDSYINHDDFVSLNNVLREYNEITEESRNPENTLKYYINIWKYYINMVDVGRKKYEKKMVYKE